MYDFVFSKIIIGELWKQNYTNIFSDATIKVRLAGSEDFFEVELSDIGDTYNSLVKCLAEELDVKSETVTKIRKLPNILIRKDRDVKRIKSGSEFEVELNTEN